MGIAIDPFVAAIHAAPAQIVYVFAGAGSRLLWELHRIPGSSRTVLEAVDCYAPRSLAHLIGALPRQAVSRATAQAMAQWAYKRAGELAEGDPPLFGLSCTAALATDRVRRGHDRCVMAIQSRTGRQSYSLTLDQQRGREGQEDLITNLGLTLLAVACGLRTDVSLDLHVGELLVIYQSDTAS